MVQSLLLCLYDNYGNVLNTKVGSQSLSTNTYGSNNGVLNETTYGNGSKKQYFYTNTGLVLAIKHNDTIKYEWKYRSDGTPLAHTDKENSLVYVYDYDSLGRLSRQKIQSTSGAHVGSTEVSYDVRNNVTKIASEFGGYTASDVYLYSSDSGNANASSYTEDNLVSRYKINGSSTRYIDYSYDGLNRLTKKSFVFDSTTKNTEYTYYASNRGSGYTTTQIDTEKLDNVSYKYYYDKVGNITGIDKNSGAYRTYTYDNKNQLTKEVNSTNGVTTNFTYDSLGNITKKVQSGAVSKTINYRYGNDGKTGWNNLLTGVDLSGNGAYESTETISYDAIGNPTTYLGATLTWFGRQLKSYTKGSTSVSYTYDADGLRGTKTYNGTKSTYHYVGGQLRYETRGNQRFYYYYDATGNLSAIRYYDANGNASIYFVLTNAQGDVVALYNSAGTCVVTYEYDAWGNIVKTTDTTGINFAELNPIRYRGYYYDSETGLYYLQSRYYNPQVGRFLNADSQLNDDILGLNTFSYCSNNPINNVDPTGHAWYHWAIATGIVAGLAIATVATAGTFAFGMTALGFATMGISVGGTTGALALATVGSATVLAASATFSALTSNTVDDFNNKGNWGTVATTAGGAIVGGAVAYASTRTPTTQIYRSVSNAEAQDIKSTGRFNLSPGAMESKQFGFSLTETRQFGKMMGQNIIVSAKLPTSMLNQFYTGGVDTSIFQSGTLTVYGDQLGMFNQAVSGTIKIMP